MTVKSQPPIKTKRLVLRPFTLSDATRTEQLAGDKRIADVTAHIPHPYPSGLAKEWISTHQINWHKGELATFAITMKDSDLLIGCISLMNISEGSGEIGYWIGTDYWNKGYCTEACIEIVNFGFETLKLNRIHANHLSRNPASSKVLLKSGLLHTGSSANECGYRKLKESIELYEKVNV